MTLARLFHLTRSTLLGGSPETPSPYPRTLPTRSARPTPLKGRGVWGCTVSLLAASTLGPTAAWSGGCGAVLPSNPAPLFTAPLSVEGAPVGNAFIDTGGGYEILLRKSFGLSLVGAVEVLAFGGKERVAVTEPFTYSVGGIEATADFALVGLSICDCNGVGFRFFRKTGTVLAVDFPAARADFTDIAPAGGVNLAFASPPPPIDDFDSAFIEVEVRFGERSITVLGLLDTGANTSVMRRGLVYSGSAAPVDRRSVRIVHPKLGTVAAQVGLFDAAGLPDLIIGTDVMRVWSDRWYFTFAPRGGHVTVFPFREAVSGL